MRTHGQADEENETVKMMQRKKVTKEKKKKERKGNTMYIYSVHRYARGRASLITTFLTLKAWTHCFTGTRVIAAVCVRACVCVCVCVCALVSLTRDL